MPPPRNGKRAILIRRADADGHPKDSLPSSGQNVSASISPVHMM